MPSKRPLYEVIDLTQSSDEDDKRHDKRPKSRCHTPAPLKKYTERARSVSEIFPPTVLGPLPRKEQFTQQVAAPMVVRVESNPLFGHSSPVWLNTAQPQILAQAKTEGPETLSQSIEYDDIPDTYYNNRETAAREILKQSEKVQAQPLPPNEDSSSTLDEADPRPPKFESTPRNISKGPGRPMLQASDDLLQPRPTNNGIPSVNYSAHSPLSGGQCSKTPISTSLDSDLPRQYVPRQHTEPTRQFGAHDVRDSWILSPKPHSAIKEPSEPSGSTTMASSHGSTSARSRSRGHGPSSRRPESDHVIASPLLQSSGTPDRELSPPTFPSFRCEWKRCGRELHNLSKLRKHVAKVHKPKDAAYECWWRKCPLLRKENEDKDWQPSDKFSSFEELLRHIETKHLEPLSWLNGEGPSDVHIGKPKSPSPDLGLLSLGMDSLVVNPSFFQSRTNTQMLPHPDPQILEKQREKFIRDPVTGRQITHQSTIQYTQSRPLDTIILPITDSALYDSFLKTHTADQTAGKKVAAEELFRAIKWRKEQVGPGIDRGGAILVTPDMRKTLRENENIGCVVDYDEDSDDGRI